MKRPAQRCISILFVCFVASCMTLFNSHAATTDAGNGFHTVDLKAAVNMDWKDDVAGDGKGGWTDQGINDMRGVETGTRTLIGIPFEIIDARANDGKAVLSLQSQHLPSGAKQTSIAVSTKCASIYFLHAAAWSTGQMATYEVMYGDGMTEAIPVRDQQEVGNWWGPKHGDAYRVALLQQNLQNVQVGMLCYGWDNPHPDKLIRSLEIVSENGPGLLVLAAVTLSQQPVSLPDPGDITQGGYVKTLDDKPSEFDPQSVIVIWIEGEQYVESNLPDHEPIGDYGRHFSESDAIVLDIPSVDEPPPGPTRNVFRDRVMRMRYAFTAPATAEYDVWMRIGPEGVYSPFRWRIDESEWSHIKRDMPYLDMFEIGTFWTFGWVNLGRTNIPAGEHSLSIEVPNPAHVTEAEKTDDQRMEDVLGDLEGIVATSKQEPAPSGRGQKGKVKAPRWLVGVDCIALSRGPFHPSGKLKPGERQDTELDREARCTYLDFSEVELPQEGRRAVLSLDGTWQTARNQIVLPGLGRIERDSDQERQIREPVLERPPVGTLSWAGVQVPHIEDPEDKLLHQRWYRRFVAMPGDLGDRHVSLCFDEVNYMCSVFVNGRLMGTHEGGYVPFSVDITDALERGKRNEIAVCVKGICCFTKPFAAGLPRERWRQARNLLVPGSPGWNRDNIDGIPGSVWIETQGSVASHDVFVQSRFSEKKLLASADLRNYSGKDFKGSVRFSVGETEADTDFLVLGEQAVSLANGTNRLVSLEGSADGLTPWWPDAGKLYRIRASTVAEDGTVLDVCEDRFGFREVALVDNYFTINGKRVNFRNVITGGEGSLTESFDAWREYNCNHLRTPHSGYTRYFRRQPDKSLLDYCDENGVCIRHCSQINGMFITILNFDPEFWQRTTHYFKQFIKAYRNHPSIIVWTAENELDLISNMGNKEYSKEEQWKMMATAHEIDPSRPVMADGAGDLMGNCEICNWHYPEMGPIVDPNNLDAVREQASTVGMAVYPDNAFTMARLSKREAEKRPWDRKKPLWSGETYFYSGTLGRQAWIGGDDAMHSRFAANEASEMYADILGRGYRWLEAAGFNLFLHYRRMPGDLIKKTLAPLAVFPREYNWTFYSGAKVPRLLRIFNDTLDPSPITFEWSLSVDGKQVASDSSKHIVKEGFNEEFMIEVPMPRKISERTDGALTFRLLRDDEVKFEEVHDLTVFPEKPVISGAEGKNIVLYDPRDRIGSILADWGVTTRKVSSLSSPLPDGALLVVGPSALTEQDRPAIKKLSDFVASGGHVLILDQEQPVSSKALPLPCPSLAVVGAYAYPRGNHRTLEGFKKYDLSCWADGHVTYRGSYVKNNDWGVIADASESDRLTLAPTVELAWGKGHYILSQLCVGEKAGKEPVADTLLANFISYLLEKPDAPAALKVISDELSGAGVLLREAKVPFQSVNPESGVGSMLLYEDTDVLVAGGTERNLQTLLAGKRELETFARNGGWVFIMRVDPSAVSTLSRLVGEELELRPIGQERIRSMGAADALMAGIGNHDFYQEQNLTKKEAEERRYLHGDLPLVDDVFENAIYYDDICRMANSLSVANHLTNEDHWQLINYGGESIGLNWRKPIEIAKVVVHESRTYHHITKMGLSFDDAEEPFMVMDVPENEGDEPVVFEFAPQTVSKLTLTAVEHKLPASGKTSGPFGWDTVEIYRVVSDSFREKVVPLTQPAGIVKFPIGKGGIVLNQMALGKAPANRVFLQMLSNLGVARGNTAGPGGGPGDIMNRLGDGLDDMLEL